MDDKKRNFILNESLYKVIATLSFPIMINNLIQTLYNIVDGMWVSKLSSVHFAATSFVWPVNFLFVSIGMGLSIAGTAIISRQIGASRYKEGDTYASQLIVLSFITSLVLAFIGFILTPSLIKLMGGSGDLAKYGEIYLKITLLDMPFMFLFSNINSIMVSQGNTVTPTVLSGISAILNCILDPIFIFTLNLGVGGAAIATLISKALLAILAFIILMNGKSVVKPKFKGFKFKRDIIKEIVRVALPSSIGQSGSSLGFIILNSFISSYGTATIAAFGMVNRITGLIMQPAMGIGSALTSVVGQNLGNNNVPRAKDAFVKSINLTVVFSVIGGILLLIFDAEVINIFMQSKDDMEVISQGITYLRYFSISLPFMGIFSVLQGIFQGSGHTKYSMAMEIGRLWFARIPLILLFKTFTDIGSIGIWISMSSSNILICIYGYLVYKTGKWQKKVIKTVNS